VSRVLPEVYLLKWDSSGLLPDDRIIILRSEQNYTGFEPIAPPFKAYVTDEYHDQLYSYIKEPFYKLRIERDNDFAIYPDINKAGVGALMPLSSIVLQRRQDLALNYKESGVEVLFYKKRTVGMLCPYCTDETTGKRLISDCEHCFGTGFLGGFLPPLKVHILMGRPREYSGQSPIGNVETSMMELHFPGWVKPSPGDVIRDPVNKMFEVSNKITEVTFQRGVIKYTTIAVECEPHDMVYRLPIPEKPTVIRYTVKTAPEEWK
jgi:hypothetical protein